MNKRIEHLRLDTTMRTDERLEWLKLYNAQLNMAGDKMKEREAEKKQREAEEKQREAERMKKQRKAEKKQREAEKKQREAIRGGLGEQ